MSIEASNKGGMVPMELSKAMVEEVRGDDDDNDVD